MKGRLVVLEGLDGSGKATQTQLLAEAFKADGRPYASVTFPHYASPSSTLVRMYLKGEVAPLEEVSPYAATSFYAADRYISYKTGWEKDYLQGKTILADRYTTSNIIYQMAKLPRVDWPEFIKWVWDFEFNKLGLPTPDRVIYLDVEPEVSQQLLLERYGGDASKKDIHEEDVAFLHQCRQAAFYAIKELGWVLVPSTKGGAMRSREEIAEEIKAHVYKEEE